MNNIELKPIKDLLGMNFHIPGYQRGYRWTRQQVRDLLDDIKEFMDSDSINIYCIQPLVIKRMPVRDSLLGDIKVAESIDEVRTLINQSDAWEVIDGQQRLTTIYIILNYLQRELPACELYSIEYATRQKSRDYLEKDLVNYKRGSEVDNIDFFYMGEAYHIVKEWFEKNKDVNCQDFRQALLDHVKFIWYEIVDEDPIRVFTRLNIGKISLTNAELIKALFLNRSNFGVSGEKHLKFRQQEIASEWDNIEYMLQNDEFWLFLNDIGYNRPTRIDFIFDLICEQNKLELNDTEYGMIGSDEYRTFRYFYEYFKSDKSNIEKCWNEVKAYFQTFKEWYDDLELYHYVGYLIVHGHTIHNLVAEWNGSTDKNYFMIELKKKIASEIKGCPPLDYQYKVDGSDKGKCKPILLFHNIQTIVNQNTNNLDNEKYQIGVFYKFPFHLYKIEGWDVEHINSNMTNEEDDLMTQKQWLMNVYLSAEETIQEKIKNFFTGNNEEKRNTLFHEIKNHFPQTDDWTPEEKNRIWNYTLLDSSTNRSYGNAIFSGKRQVIIGKDKGMKISIPKMTKDGKLELIKEEKAKSSFVPICTKQVFMKYYSSIMSDANYWTKIDAEGYKRDIEECLNKLKFEYGK